MSLKSIRTPKVELRLTEVQLGLIEAAQHTVVADERFEHLNPAEDPIQGVARTASCTARSITLWFPGSADV
jgi:hypothetical protein